MRGHPADAAHDPAAGRSRTRTSGSRVGLFIRPCVTAIVRIGSPKANRRVPSAAGGTASRSPSPAVPGIGGSGSSSVAYHSGPRYRADLSRPSSDGSRPPIMTVTNRSGRVSTGTGPPPPPSPRRCRATLPARIDRSGRGPASARSWTSLEAAEHLEGHLRAFEPAEMAVDGERDEFGLVHGPTHPARQPVVGRHRLEVAQDPLRGIRRPQEVRVLAVEFGV